MLQKFAPLSNIDNITLYGFLINHQTKRVLLWHCCKTIYCRNILFYSNIDCIIPCVFLSTYIVPYQGCDQTVSLEAEKAETRDLFCIFLLNLTLKIMMPKAEKAHPWLYILNNRLKYSNKLWHKIKPHELLVWQDWLHASRPSQTKILWFFFNIFFPWTTSC